MLPGFSMLALLLALAAAQPASVQQYFKPFPRATAVKYITTNAEEHAGKRVGSVSAPFAVEDLVDAAGTFNGTSVAGVLFLLAGGEYRFPQRVVCVFFVVLCVL